MTKRQKINWGICLAIVSIVLLIEFFFTGLAEYRNYLLLFILGWAAYDVRKDFVQKGGASGEIARFLFLMGYLIGQWAGDAMWPFWVAFFVSIPIKAYWEWPPRNSPKGQEGEA